MSWRYVGAAMEYRKTLTHLGLSDKEAAAYVALLKLGEGTAQQIAKESGLKRPTAYIILDNLRLKGFVLKTPSAKRTRFTAKSPRGLYEEYLGRIQDTARAIPMLEALHKSDKRINTMYFEGPAGVAESLEYKLGELSGTKIDGFWAKVDTWDAQTKKHIDRWGEIAAASGIAVRAIAPEHESLKSYRKSDTAMRRIIKTAPLKTYSSNTSIEVTDLFLRITQFDPPQAVIIESAELVKTVRQIFNMVWKSLDKE